MKTHYELLSLPSTADADAIKKAFRREIARYHPDKVIHLGAEFQDMAATRAAELTVAYKTLSDPALREEYDASIAGGPAAAARAAHAPARVPRQHAARRRRRSTQDTPPPPPGTKGRFASERADRDVILTRAIAGRVLGIVETLYGKIETPTVRGFDLAMVPLAKPRFLGAHPPRVLVKVVGTADAAAITETYGAASRARAAHRQVADRRAAVRPHDCAAAGDRRRPTKPMPAAARRRDGPEEVAVVVVDTADWSCRLPPGCSTAVHKLTDQICS